MSSSQYRGTLAPTESPTTSRAKSLSTKLQDLQASLENEKLDRNAMIDSKFRNLDDRLQQQQFTQESRFKIIKDELTGLEERLHSCRLEREILEERNGKAIKDIQETVMQAMGIEQQSFKDSENQLLKVIDDRFYGLTVEIQDVRRRREDAEVHVSSERQENMSKLVHMLDLEQRVMEDQSDKILQKMLEEMQRLHTLTELERKVRDETTKSMARMFDELSVKIQHDVESERRERESAEDGMLRVIEETCGRVIARSNHL